MLYNEKKNLLVRDKPLQILRFFPQTEVAVHSHDFEELVIICGGKGKHIVNDFTYPIQKGDVFVIKEGISHAYKDTEDLNLINIIYYTHKININIQELEQLPGYQTMFHLEPDTRTRTQFSNFLHISDSRLGRLLLEVEQLETELDEQRDGFFSLAQGFLQIIMARLSRWYNELNRENRSNHLLTISDIIIYMKNHLDERLVIKDVAEKCDISTSTLLRNFQVGTGMSPQAYFIHLKIEKACSLLISGELSISDISFQLGYDDSGFFSRQFKKIKSVTPREYRKHYKNSLAQNN